MNIDEIARRLPHAFPFILIDRILELKPGEHVVASKCVSAGEFWGPGHFPEERLMPGVLIVEAMAQTGGFLFQDPQSPARRSGYIAAMDKVRFGAKVIPGDVLVLTAEPINSLGSMAKVQCKGSVDGQEVCSAVLTYHFPEPPSLS